MASFREGKTEGWCGAIKIYGNAHHWEIELLNNLWHTLCFSGY